MHNVEGKCWHSKCAITDPSYKMPGKVADEKARTWHKYHKIDPKELKDDEE